MNRLARLWLIASLLVAPAAVAQGDLAPIDVPTAIGRSADLAGQRIAVTGWLNECTPGGCLLYATPKPAGRTTTPPMALALGESAEIDRMAHAFRFSGVVVEGRLDTDCTRSDRPCLGHSGFLLSPDVVRVADPRPNRDGWAYDADLGNLTAQPLTADPALLMATRRHLAMIGARDLDGARRAYVAFDPETAARIAESPERIADHVARMQATLFEGERSPADAFAGEAAATVPIRILKDPATDASLAEALGAEDVATVCACTAADCARIVWPTKLHHLLHNRANGYICFDAARRDGIWRIASF